MSARRQNIPADPHTIEGALAKIERVLPDELRVRLQAVQSSVASIPASTMPQPPGEMVLLISTAIQQQRRVQMRYQSQHAETTRDIDPYGLVTHWNHWYIVGWRHMRQAIRVFRLDRILAAVIEEKTFARPVAFDSLQYVIESLATAPWGFPVEVLLETTLEDARRRIPAGSALLKQTTSGVVMHAHVERLEWLARTLLMLGFPFVIRQPPELRTALRAVASEAAALADRQEYGNAGTGDADDPVNILDPQQDHLTSQKALGVCRCRR